MGKKKDAIPQDVSEEEPSEHVEEQVAEPEESTQEEEYVDHNQALREEIAASHEREIAEELGLSPEEEEPEEDAVPVEEDGEPEADAEEEPVEAEEEASPEETRQPLQIEDDALYSVKVDGEEQTITGRDMKARSQKDLSADKRLEEATRLLKEAREIQEAADKTRAAREEPEQKQEAPPEPDVPREELIAALEAIQMGDTEEGAAAFEKILKGLRTSAPDTPEPAVREVVQKVLHQREQMTIRERFFSAPDEGGFADLVPEQDGGTGDHITFAAVNAEVQRLIGVEKKPDAWATYKQAGINVRERFFPKEAAHQNEEQEDPTQQTKETKAKKTERKRRLVSVKPATGAPNMPEAEEDEENITDVIQQMAKDRNLA